MAVLSYLSCPDCPFLAGLSWLFYPGCSLLDVLFTQSYPGCLVLAVLVHSYGNRAKNKCTVIVRNGARIKYKLMGFMVYF
jgi:hypothetical protein